MSWTHIEDKDVNARKGHVCDLCGQNIQRGDQYRRRVGIDENGPVTMHMHPECERETRSWEPMDWETFCPGEFERPDVGGVCHR